MSAKNLPTPAELLGIARERVRLDINICSCPAFDQQLFFNGFDIEENNSADAIFQKARDYLFKYAKYPFSLAGFEHQARDPERLAALYRAELDARSDESSDAIIAHTIQAQLNKLRKLAESYNEIGPIDLIDDLDVTDEIRDALFNRIIDGD